MTAAALHLAESGKVPVAFSRPLGTLVAVRAPLALGGTGLEARGAFSAEWPERWELLPGTCSHGHAPWPVAFLEAFPALPLPPRLVATIVGGMWRAA